MIYWYDTMVWIRETDKEAQKLNRLINKDTEGELKADPCMVDLGQFRYFYMTTMLEVGDSTFVQLKGGDYLILAEPFTKVQTALKEAVDFFNSPNG